MPGDEERHVVESGAWSAWLDGELGEGERARVQAHLAACPACRTQVEEWRALRRQLAAYAPPVEPPGAAEAFWAHLAPELPPAPRRRPDPALYLAPAALALVCALVQGMSWAWEVAGPLGGQRVLAAAWRWLAASRLVATIAGMLPGPAPVLPPGWSSPLWALAGSAVSWTATAALALLYIAWLALWLRPPAPVGERR